MMFFALAVQSATASAQEDDTADHGSRAVAKASRMTPAPRRKAKNPFTPSYHAGAFGGGFVQDDALGLLINAGVGELVALGRERLRLGLEYQYDPFTTKTFNFPEEDQAQITSSRLTQSLHELDARAEWQSRWSRWLRSTLNLSGDVWLPEVAADRRWSLRSEAELHAGKSRGAFAESGIAWFLKKYPDYHVADRRIDQQGGEVSLEAGYQWKAFTSAALGVEVELTSYLDARYDALTADGSVVRASDSKRYLSTRPFARVAVAPAHSVRLSLAYNHELNDSSEYARRIPARDELDNPVVKFIPDYYDYARDRLDFKAKFAPSKNLSMSILAEGWLRDFDTYEARDADNAWTGQLRHDQSLELGAEIAFHLFDIDTFGVPNGVYATGFGSHLLRRSNMQREVSMATNFDVTRVFMGLELKPR